MGRWLPSDGGGEWACRVIFRHPSQLLSHGAILFRELAVCRRVFPIFIPATLVVFGRFFV